MRALLIARCLASLVLFPASSPWAQTTQAPAPFIRITREVVKVGRGGPHVLLEAGWPRAYANAKTPNAYLAMTTTFGPSEAWYVGSYASLAHVEATDKALGEAPGLGAELDRLSQADAENLESVRTILARHVAEASNGPYINPAEVRIWAVTIYRVRPGKQASFMESARLHQSLAQRAGVHAPWSTYEVLAGLPGPTYLVIAPHRTLGEIDPGTGAYAAVQRAMTEANRRAVSALSEGFVSVETMIFAPSPEMSHLPPDWIAQDPRYWGRKAPPNPMP